MPFDLIELPRCFVVNTYQVSCITQMKCNDIKCEL